MSKKLQKRSKAKRGNDILPHKKKVKRVNARHDDPKQHHYRDPVTQRLLFRPPSKGKPTK